MHKCKCKFETLDVSEWVKDLEGGPYVLYFGCIQHSLTRINRHPPAYWATRIVCLDTLQSSCNYRVTRKRCMFPLQNIRSYNIRNKKAPWRATTWARLLSLSLLYCQFNSPLNSCHHLWAGNDGLRSVLCLWCVKLSRKGIRLWVLRASSIKEDEIETVKKKEPIGPGFNLLASRIYMRFLWSV